MMVLFYTKMVVLSAYNFLFANYPEGCEPVLIYGCGKRHSVRIPPTVFESGFLVCLIRLWHKRLFQKLPKTRLLYCDMFCVHELRQLGSFCAYATTRIGTHESWLRNPVSRLGAVWQFHLRCWTQAIYVVMLRRSSNICYGISKRAVDCTPFRLPDSENLNGFAIIQ